MVTVTDAKGNVLRLPAPATTTPALAIAQRLVRENQRAIVTGTHRAEVIDAETLQTIYTVEY